MIKVRIRYFASVREALGDGETLDVPAGTTLRAVREQLMARSDVHADALGPGHALRMALNMDMCNDDTTPITPDGAQAEVAFFPPVTGG